LGTQVDDARLLSGFFIDDKDQYVFAPSRSEDSVSLEQKSLKPFFLLLSSVSERIDKLDSSRARKYLGIHEKIQAILKDKASIGTNDGEIRVGLLNADVRDFKEMIEEEQGEYIFSTREMQQLQEWRDVLHECIEFWTFLDANSKARLAVLQSNHAPKVIEAEKRRISRSGGGFSVYVSPSEAQITGLKNEISVELTEEGDSKYLSLRALP
jgi:hypothetical protein